MSKVYFKSHLLKVLFLTNFSNSSKSTPQAPPSGVSRTTPMNSSLADINRCILQTAMLGYWLSHTDNTSWGWALPCPQRVPPR